MQNQPKQNAHYYLANNSTFRINQIPNKRFAEKNSNDFRGLPVFSNPATNHPNTQPRIVRVNPQNVSLMTQNHSNQIYNQAHRQSKCQMPFFSFLVKFMHLIDLFSNDNGILSNFCSIIKSI